LAKAGQAGQQEFYSDFIDESTGRLLILLENIADSDVIRLSKLEHA
jgi:hypothetical protein